MILAIDIGNSQTVLGLLDGREVRHHWRLTTEPRRTADEVTALVTQLFAGSGMAGRDVEGAVLSSVVAPLTATWEAALTQVTGAAPLTVSARGPLPIALAVDNPREVGTDRIANAVAAHTRFGAPVLVVDFGTATNIDVVDREGNYGGGVILPGPEISAEALFQRTAALPRIALTRPEKIIGTNTIACMQSGLFHGFLGAIERLIDAVREELESPACRAVATGGLGGLVVKETDRLEDYLPWLTLEGLVLIWAHSRA